MKGEDEIITHLTVGFLLMQFLLYWLIVIILILDVHRDGWIVIYLIEKRYRAQIIFLPYSLADRIDDVSLVTTHSRGVQNVSFLTNCEKKMMLIQAAIPFCD